MAETVYFDATLRPHRSLDKRGFLLVMSAIGGVGFLVGFSFFLAGAWPVAGFCGLEVLLVYLAFRLNFRDAKRSERLRLTDDALEIERRTPRGTVSIDTLQPAWLQVLPDPIPPDGQVRRLALRTHGREVAVGTFLTPLERGEIALALRRALADYRAPA